MQLKAFQKETLEKLPIIVIHQEEGQKLLKRDFILLWAILQTEAEEGEIRRRMKLSQKDKDNLIKTFAITMDLKILQDPFLASEVIDWSTVIAIHESQNM